MSIYTENGYTGRRDYLQNLAAETGVDFETVCALASMLGPSEDFDGLVTSLEDHAADLERDAARARDKSGHAATL